MKQPVTLSQIRRWGPTCDVSQAAEALGVSRASAYSAISTGQFPVAVIRVNRRMRVLTADLIRVLEGSSAPHRASA